MEYCIYKFTNKINNKVYIGSTKLNKIKSRYSQHKSAAKNGTGFRFHKALKKHGIDNFIFEIICSISQKEYLDQIEQWFINIYDALNFEKGYNSIGVTKGNRELVSKFLRNEWSKPEKRKQRLESMIRGSQKESIVSVSIYDGSYKIYESIHDALRKGFSTSSIYSCLNNKAKKGQGYCWFYYKEQNSDLYIQKARELIGEFKNEYFKPIEARHKETGEILTFKNTFELKERGFEAKAVRRVLRGEREGYKSYYWKYI